MPCFDTNKIIYLIKFIPISMFGKENLNLSEIHPLIKIFLMGAKTFQIE